jgi:AraC family transcriptional regulator
MAPFTKDMTESNIVVVSLKLSALDGATFWMDRVSLATYPPGATFGPRVLADYEFVWLEEGNAVWECDGTIHQIPAGTLLLARPGMRDSFIWDRERFTRHGYLHFRVTRRGGLPPEHTWPFTRPLGEGDIVRPLFRHLAWLSVQSGPDASILCQGAMRQILLLFISGACGTVNPGASDESPIIDRVMRYVRGRWSNGVLLQPPLTELARAGAVSRGHLVRTFREHLGATPAEALRLLRLDRAAVLLARSNLRVQQVADQTGFESAFHFSRAFRRIYGCSPRAFRERMAAGHPLPTIGLVRMRHLAEQL